MKQDKLFIILPIIAIILFVVVYSFLFVSNVYLSNQIIEQSKEIDSLKQETFCYEIQIQKYESIYDLLDKGCQNQYDSASNLVE